MVHDREPLQGRAAAAAASQHPRYDGPRAVAVADAPAPPQPMRLGSVALIRPIPATVRDQVQSIPQWRVVPQHQSHASFAAAVAASTVVAQRPITAPRFARLRPPLTNPFAILISSVLTSAIVVVSLAGMDQLMGR